MLSRKRMEWPDKINSNIQNLFDPGAVCFSLIGGTRLQIRQQVNFSIFSGYYESLKEFIGADRKFLLLY